MRLGSKIGLAGALVWVGVWPGSRGLLGGGGPLDERSEREDFIAVTGWSDAGPLPPLLQQLPSD